MINASIQKYLNQFLSQDSGEEITIKFQPVGGGSINDCFRISLNNGPDYFLKVNSSALFPSLFAKEKNGLEFLGGQKILRVPAVIQQGHVEDKQLLLMEWVENGLRTEQFWKQFGEGLARLHQVSDPHFGFEEDNYMGALPQSNDRYGNWNDFFIDCRLIPQVKLATEKGLILQKHLAAFENLYKKLPGIFNEEKPSLLHGDLWSGNFMCNEDGEAVLIDPAVYFGNRNMDLAMTTLFGGFDKLFYESYHHHFPFASNYKEQWEICNLYPLLIHLNLFGSGYLSQIQTILKKY